jgi:glycosyltransferase involved in cell wall biosynthesis
MNHDLTIVIPCKNEVDYIEHTLDSINNQIGVDNVDVIVADARSDDGTLELLKDYRQRPSTRFKLHIINGGAVAYARNTGSKFIKRRYIVFIDADVTLPSKISLWMTYSLLEGSSDGSLPKYDLVTCNFESRSNSFLSKLAFKIFNFTRNNLMSEPFAVGGFFATRRDAFEKYGRFDETVMHTEDYLLSRKYDPAKFAIITSMTATQDDRRFKKMGYLKFLWMLLVNYINRDRIDHFRKDINYWS